MAPSDLVEDPVAAPVHAGPTVRRRQETHQTFFARGERLLRERRDGRSGDGAGDADREDRGDGPHRLQRVGDAVLTFFVALLGLLGGLLRHGLWAARHVPPRTTMRGS